MTTEKETTWYGKMTIECRQAYKEKMAFQQNVRNQKAKKYDLLVAKLKSIGLDNLLKGIENDPVHHASGSP